jgi:hypothetical protein
MSLVSVVYCQVAGSATGRSLVQRSPTDCGGSECDGEAWIKRGTCPIRGSYAIGGHYESHPFNDV